MVQTRMKRKLEETDSVEEFRKKRKVKEENHELVQSSFTRHGEFYHVLKYIFRNLGVQRLKLCRLVCKMWDEEACKALEKASIVSLHSTESRTRPGRMRDFVKLLQARDPEFPLPFKSCRMMENLDDTEYRNYLKVITGIVPNFQVVELGVEQSEDPFRPSQQSSFQSHASGLRELHLTRAVPGGILLSFPAGTHFLQLESFTINGKVSLSILESVVHASPRLKHIHCQGVRDNTFGIPLLRQLMSDPNFLRIKSFEIASVELRDFQDLPCLKNLRSLIISDCLQTLSPEKSHQLLASLKSFTRNLTHLDIQCLNLDPTILRKYFPSCQNLNHLQVKALSTACGVLERCPSLKSIQFRLFDLSSGSCEEMEMVGCETVEALEFFQTPFRRTIPNYMGFSLRKLFPNWNNFWISSPCSFSKAGFSQFNVCQWNIQSLTLSGHIPLSGALFKFLTGLRMKVPRIRNGSKLNQPNVPDLQGLKSLVLQSSNLTDSFLEFGISRMRLDLFQFKWNKELSVGIAVKSLSHIPEVVVMGCCEPEFGRQMEQLFSQLASVRCGCGRRWKGYLGFSKLFQKTERPAEEGLSHLSVVRWW